MMVIVIDATKSEAVRLYTRRGRSPFPLEDPDAVRRMTVPSPAALLAYVQGVVDEMWAAYPLNWETDRDPVEVMRLVEAGMGTATRNSTPMR
jgi:hypothetical protein